MIVVATRPRRWALYGFGSPSLLYVSSLLFLESAPGRS